MSGLILSVTSRFCNRSSLCRNRSGSFPLQSCLLTWSRKGSSVFSGSLQSILLHISSSQVLESRYLHIYLLCCIFRLVLFQWLLLLGSLGSFRFVPYPYLPISFSLVFGSMGFPIIFFVGLVHFLVPGELWLF
jgi:hypothetical protein